jgi:hypothetical protein
MIASRLYVDYGSIDQKETGGLADNFPKNGASKSIFSVSDLADWENKRAVWMTSKVIDTSRLVAEFWRIDRSIYARDRVYPRIAQGLECFPNAPQMLHHEFDTYRRR